MGISYIVYGIYGEKYIMWDGCNYFSPVLQKGEFMRFPRGRMTADTLMQVFAVAAWHFGCVDPAIIGALQGFGCTFWTVLFYLLAVLVCIRHKRTDYAKMVLIFACMNITFKGLFLQMESTLGVALFLLQFVIVLLWETKKESTYNRLILALSLACSIHMNEYFLLWDLLLISIIMWRLFGERKIEKNWGVIIAFLIVNIAVCWTDIKANGAEAAGMNPLLQLRLAFYNKEYAVSCILIVLILLLCVNNSPKWKIMGVIALTLVLTVYQIHWYRKEAMVIGMWAFPTRLTCLGWSLLGTFAIALIHFRSKKTVLFSKTLIILCICLCLTTVFFNRRTGHEYRNYNTRRVVMCVINPDRGYLDCKETEIGNYSFNVEGTMRLECLELLAMRGIKEINTVLTDKKIGNDVNVDFSRYGITIKKECFQD